MLGPMQEVSWVKTVLPELLWIALIHDYHGLRKGIELISELGRVARSCLKSKALIIFGAISSFGELDDEQKNSIRNKLTSSGALFLIQKAILPLIAFYPECYLKFLFYHEPSPTDRSKENLERLKSVIDDLYDKTSKRAMMVQATMTWLGFDSGAFKVHKDGTLLANFPEIEKYPLTNLSKKVAASIRAAINMFFIETHYPVHTEWPTYFWNHGLQIDRCYFEDASNG